jgi:hypothetical protein
MIFFNRTGCAEEVTVTLPCNDDPFGPTEYPCPGIPGALQSLTIMGVRARVGNHTELFAKRYSEYSYMGLVTLPIERLKMLRRLNIDVRAKCTISSDVVDMWPTRIVFGRPSRKTLSCGPGEGITIYIHHPDCNMGPDQQVVFTLTKTKIEDEEITSVETYEETYQVPMYYDYELGVSLFSGKYVAIYEPHF